MASGKFNASTYGDGSLRPFVWGLFARAAFAIVQYCIEDGRVRVQGVLAGPVPSFIQTSPLAELCAAVHAIRNTEDVPSLQYHTDCEWVINGWLKGPEGTTRCTHVHADWWRALFKAIDSRQWPMGLVKVKSHESKTEAEKNGTLHHRTGSGLSDAAAKFACSFHSLPVEQIQAATDIYAFATNVFKLIGRITERKTDRKRPASADPEAPQANEGGKLVIVADPKHVTITDAKGVRCVWCHRRAKGDTAMERGPCTWAPGHVVWANDAITMCAKCGAYCESRTRYLTAVCSPPDRNARVRMRRFFDKQLHPASMKHLKHAPKPLSKGSTVRDWQDRANEQKRIHGKTPSARSKSLQQPLDFLFLTRTTSYE